MSWRRFFRRDQWDRERSSEIQTHLEIEIDDNISRGMSAEEARSAAYRKLGNPSRIREEIYRMNTIDFVETLVQDLRYTVRTLLKSPGFTLVTVLTLALGIGANTAIFSAINAVLLRPLPYKEPSRLVTIWADHHLRGGPVDEWTNPADFFDWRAQSNTLEDMAVLGASAPTLIGNGEPELLRGAKISYSMFSVLGVTPMLGRNFTAEDDRPNAAHVAVLSDDLWRRRFSADSKVLGKTINLDGIGHTIVGVMPAGFAFPIVPNREVWTTLQLPPRGRGNAVLRAIGRLKASTTLAQSQTEMTAIAGRLAQAYPDTNKGIGISLIPLQEQIGGKARKPLWLLWGAVGLVLLIACANVANLLLARAASRQKEISVRVGLGARRTRLVRQLLTESCLLALLGGVIGLFLAFWGTVFLSRALPATISSVEPVKIDLAVLLFTLALSVLTGLGFGLAPALQATRANVTEVLKENARSASGGKGGRRLRSILVIADVTIALALSVSAGLLMKSFLRLTSVDLGFRQDHLLEVTVRLPRQSYSDRAKISNFYEQLTQRLAALPGVTAVSAASDPPLNGVGGSDSDFFIEGKPMPQPDKRPVAWYSSVMPNFHQTMGMALLKGRNFNDHDTADSQPVVLINQTMARRYWGDEDPVGKRISDSDPANPKWKEIVGIVGNVKYFTLEAEQPPMMYLPLQQTPNPGMTLAVRTTGPPLEMAAPVRSAVWSLDKNLAVPSFTTMEQLVEGVSDQPRLLSSLIGAFAIMALLLAAVGLYGVMAYTVTERTHEMGIRMALGATRSSVLGMILSQGLKLSILGIAAGLLISVAFTRVLGTFLFRVGSTDPTTFAGVALLLVTVAFAASYIPARRAMRVDPMVALRYE
ncbi:MAG TPA: ABC transporter permease [Candidatus Angelobacter sp.]|jgi:putative ABC transport system permease protein|nr:ABC transporter permease [Candidatus Angelobacter sp.]